MKINIHIGVHKTATTYTQNLLHHNRAALRAAGIGYISLWDFRATFTQEFMGFTPETFKIDKILPQFFGGKVPKNIKGLIISEENLIGYCGSLLMSGKPYPTAEERLAHFRKLLVGHEITMFASIREYGSFLSSAYCEGIRNISQFVPFEEYRNRLKWSKMQWPLLLEKFEEGLKPDHTKLWCYEDFRAHSAHIIDAIAFNAGVEMAKPTGSNVEYPSFSTTTVDVLEAVSAKLGAEAANVLIKPVAETFPKGELHAGFNPWTSHEDQLLKKLYMTDCLLIDPRKWLIDETVQKLVAKAA